MSLNRKGGTWAGGYISLGARARKTYVLERKVNGQRFHVSTRTHDERAALRHLDRFESNPLVYRPVGEEGDGPLRISVDDVDRYVKWSRQEKGNTREHVREVKRYLSHWVDDLGGADWRGLKVSALKRCLDERKTARAYRIASIKAFCAWLREERGVLTSEQDATRDLASIQATPEKQRREKKVPKAVVEQLLAAKVKGTDTPLLDDRTRNFLLVKAVTGFHHTEIMRIVRGQNATIEELDETAASRAGCPAVVRFIHKNGDAVVKRVETQQLLDALRALEARGFTMRRVNAAIGEACRELKLEEWTAGVLRHSWGTWHVEGGATIEAVAAGYSHKSKRTTERFYVQVAVPGAALPAVTLKTEH